MDEEPVKCDLYKRCLHIRFFKRRLEHNLKSLEIFKSGHCFSNNYKSCLFYPISNGLVPKTLSDLDRIQKIYYIGKSLK